MPIETNPTVGKKDNLTDLGRVWVQSKSVGKADILAGNVVNNGIVA